MSERYDAIVIGSGPNGLAAAITLSREKWRVLIIEGEQLPGGGARSAELTRPGFVHDICSTTHPFGTCSPFFRGVPLHKHGLEWVWSPAPLAHPLLESEAAVLERSVDETARSLDGDSEAYKKMLEPLTRGWETLQQELLAPPHIPRAIADLIRFSLPALRSAKGLTDKHFHTERARNLFLGLAAHSILPLDQVGSAAIGLVLGAAAHTHGWPFPRGGAQKITDSMISYFKSLDGDIVCGQRVTSLNRIPPSRVVMLDTSIPTLISIAGDRLAPFTIGRLRRYRYGPGVFKMDFALSGPIPWSDPKCRTAATIHLGATSEEMALSERSVWEGKHPLRPFVLLAQHSLFDTTRAPAGGHTVWAYCHVPPNSTVDMSTAIEGQIERFAPGFQKLIVERHAKNTIQMVSANSNLVGGDVTGGANILSQLICRPVWTWSPYRLPAKGLYLCSAATPPGAGVHGMCGYYAAKQVLRDFANC